MNVGTRTVCGGSTVRAFAWDSVNKCNHEIADRLDQDEVPTALGGRRRASTVRSVLSRV